MATIDHKYAPGIRIALQTLREQYERDKAQKEALLAEAERNCHGGKHRFGPTEYVPIHHEGYRASDPFWHPGRGPEREVWVEARDEPCWRRVCQDCGREEFTTRSEERVEKKHDPVW